MATKSAQAPAKVTKANPTNELYAQAPAKVTKANPTNELYAQANAAHGVIDGDTVIKSIELPKAGLSTLFKQADTGKGALHKIALGLMLGQVNVAELAAIEVPRSIKNEGTYIRKLCEYVTAHDANALRLAWNESIHKSERTRAVSLSALTKAIAPTLPRAPKTDASKADTSGAVEGEREVAPDLIATLDQIRDMVASIADNKKLGEQIRKLAVFSAQQSKAA